MRSRAILFVIVGLALSVVPVAAQGVTGTLFGVVADESAGVLPGATATITSSALPGGPRITVTSAQGEYRFTELQPGIYGLTIELPGFSMYDEIDLRVTAGGTTERNISLPLASVAETITVTGESPVVDTRRSGITATRTVEEVERLPIERRATTDYAKNLPGATASSYNATNGISIMGSNTSGVTMTQDGAQYNNVKSGGGYPIQDVDGVEEVNVTLLGASAEYQQAAGGVMNVIMKSGTNQFRGDARWYQLSKGTMAEPVKLPCNCPEGETAQKWYGNLDYSLHAGGPIVKDRLWLFAGGTKIQWSFRSPGEAAPPQDLLDQGIWQRYDSRMSWKWTWKISDSVSFTQSNLYEWWEYLTPFPNRTRAIESVRWYPGDIRVGGSAVNWTVNNSTVLTARYSAFLMPDSLMGMGPNLTQNDITTPARRDSFLGRDTGNAFAGGTARWPRRDEFALKVNHYLTGEGVTHNIKYGGGYRTNRTNDQLIFSGGVRYTDVNGKPDQAEYTDGASWAAQEKAYSVWGEDEVNIGQRVTLQLGARWDRMTGVSNDAPEIVLELQDRGTIILPFFGFKETGNTISGLGDMFTWNTVSPRLGINIKLSDDGRTVLRSTFGRFYQRIILNDFLSLHPGNAPTTLRAWDDATQDYTTFISTIDPKVNLGIDPNIKPEWTNSMSIGIERELVANMAANVSYAYKRWGNLIGWVDSGGVYGTQEITTPAGAPLTVFPLLNSTGDRFYERTNGPGYDATYKGLMFSLTKRLSNGWLARANYTYSDFTQFKPGGRDPNDLINADAPTASEGRPHVFNFLASFAIPKIDMHLATNISLASGRAYARTFRFRLPQGNRTIIMDPAGVFRTPFEQYAMVRVTKNLRLGPNRTELILEIRNMFNETWDGRWATTQFGSPNFGKQRTYAWPRRMYFGIRYFFN